MGYELCCELPLAAGTAPPWSRHRGNVSALELLWFRLPMKGGCEQGCRWNRTGSGTVRFSSVSSVAGSVTRRRLEQMAGCRQG